MNFIYIYIESSDLAISSVFVQLETIIMNSIEQVIKNTTKTYLVKINTVLDQFSPLTIAYSNDKHIIERMKERDLDVQDLAVVLNKFYRTNLPEFIDLATRQENQRPFKIEVKNKHIIIALSRIDEYKWKITTVLDPKIHSKYERTTGYYQKYINVDIPPTGVIDWNKLN